MIKLVSILILSCTLFGCVTVPKQDNNVEVENKISLNEVKFFGSGLDNSSNYTYTQFNEKYAVTAKHTEKTHKVVWTCDDCDLIFFEHKLKGFKNEEYWGKVKPLSNVKLYGHVGIFIKELEGRDLNIVGFVNSVLVGNLMTITPIKGMSGGPVVSGGKIVGMNIGYEGTTKKGIYIPYSKIMEEYEKFQNTL